MAVYLQRSFGKDIAFYEVKERSAILSRGKDARTSLPFYDLTVDVTVPDATASSVTLTVEVLKGGDLWSRGQVPLPWGRPAAIARPQDGRPTASKNTRLFILKANKH